MAQIQEGVADVDLDDDDIFADIPDEALVNPLLQAQVAAENTSVPLTEVQKARIRARLFGSKEKGDELITNFNNVREGVEGLDTATGEEFQHYLDALRAESLSGVINERILKAFGFMGENFLFAGNTFSRSIQQDKLLQDALALSTTRFASSLSPETLTLALLSGHYIASWGRSERPSNATVEEIPS